MGSAHPHSRAYPPAIELEDLIPDRVERPGMGFCPAHLVAKKELQVWVAVVDLAILVGGEYRK